MSGRVVLAGVTFGWVAFEYATDQHAKTAWERAHRGRDSHCGIWRYREPTEPPWRRFAVVAVSERDDKLQATARILRRLGGRECDVPEDLAHTLAGRRLEHILAGGGRYEVRVPGGFTMDRAGRRYLRHGGHG